MKKLLILNIVIFVLLCSCDTTKNDEEFKPETIIQIETDKKLVFADGVSFAEIKAKIDKNAAIDRRNITFISNGGTLSNETAIQADVDGIAKIKITNLKEETIYITAQVTVNNQKYVSKEVSITYERAYPDEISIYPEDNNFTIKSGLANSKQLSIKLIRDVGFGKVTTDTNVLYEATDTLNNSIGIFFNPVRSNDEGNATVFYTANDNNYRGEIKIKASVLNHTTNTFIVGNR